MTLHWTKEDDPRWDADKQRLFGPGRAGRGGSGPAAPLARRWLTSGGR